MLVTKIGHFGIKSVDIKEQIWYHFYIINRFEDNFNPNLKADMSMRGAIKNT